MAITHKIGVTYDGGAGRMSSASRSISGSGELRIQETIPAASTDLPVAFALDRDAVKALGISSNKAITIKTNSSASPTDTIAVELHSPAGSVAPGQVIAWGDDEDALADMVFSADVTGLYITNAGADVATLRIEALTDVTP